MPSTNLGAKPAGNSLSAPSLSAPDRLGQLKALHLCGTATAWNELLAEGPRRPMQPGAWLDRLIEAELADRQVRNGSPPSNGTQVGNRGDFAARAGRGCVKRRRNLLLFAGVSGGVR